MAAYDWSHLQSFIAVAEHGSLSAAARATGSSQPTLSRHVALLEQAAGARLFERSKAGVTLTDRGAALMTHAARMADAAAQIARLPQDAPDMATGTVRLTASRIVATYLLPEVLTEMRVALPGVEIELVASDDSNNLLRREADIALRMYRPTQGDVIARHIGNLELGAYASEDYLARKGTLNGIDDLRNHDVIGYDRSTLIIDAMAALGLKVGRDFFAFRCDDQVVCWEMVRAGFGIGFNQRAVAERDPHLVRVSDDIPVGALPVWLTAHAELRQTPRIRKVYDHLAGALAPHLSRP